MKTEGGDNMAVNMTWANLLSWWILALQLKPFKPEFTIVIFIHYKPRIASAILDL